jgi:hypothetical protein
MCNWALRFRTGFRPFYFSRFAEASFTGSYPNSSPQILVTLLRESGHNLCERHLLALTMW